MGGPSRPPRSEYPLLWPIWRQCKSDEDLCSFRLIGSHQDNSACLNSGLPLPAGLLRGCGSHADIIDWSPCDNTTQAQGATMSCIYGLVCLLPRASSVLGRLPAYSPGKQAPSVWQEGQRLRNSGEALWTWWAGPVSVAAMYFPVKNNLQSFTAKSQYWLPVDYKSTHPQFDSRWYTFGFIQDVVTNCKVLPR